MSTFRKEQKLINSARAQALALSHTIMFTQLQKAESTKFSRKKGKHFCGQLSNGS